MGQYVTEGQVKLDGVVHEAGADVELTDDQVKALPEGTVTAKSEVADRSKRAAGVERGGIAGTEKPVTEHDQKALRAEAFTEMSELNEDSEVTVEQLQKWQSALNSLRSAQGPNPMDPAHAKTLQMVSDLTDPVVLQPEQLVQIRNAAANLLIEQGKIDPERPAKTRAAKATRAQAKAAKKPARVGGKKAPSAKATASRAKRAAAEAAKKKK